VEVVLDPSSEVESVGDVAALVCAIVVPDESAEDDTVVPPSCAPEVVVDDAVSDSITGVDEQPAAMPNDQHSPLAPIAGL
jgi:hypothetical protein